MGMIALVGREVQEVQGQLVYPEGSEPVDSDMMDLVDSEMVDLGSEMVVLTLDLG